MGPGPTRLLFDALGEIHRHDELEDLLDYTTRTVVAASGWSTALLSFYFGEEIFLGAANCPEGTKAGFRENFRRTSEEDRQAKRRRILEYAHADTRICFIPAGEGPALSAAFVPSEAGPGDWRPEDRLMIFMFDWEDRIHGVLSLDDPKDGNRPDAAELERLRDIERFVDVVGKIAENRFWSFRVEESEAAYRGVFTAARDGFLIFDESDRIVQANPSASRLFGYGRDELIGMHGYFLVHEADREAVRGAMDRVRATGFADLEYRGVRKDGRGVDLEVHANRVRLAGRRHTLAVVRDITERKKVLERLLEQQKHESVVTVAGGVAHDFNNTLMGVTGSLSLLRRKLPAGSEEARHVDRIQASAEKLAALTSQLLAVAQGAHSEMQPLRLSEVVRESLALMGDRRREQCRIEVEIDDDLWPVEADRIQLDQVLFDLLTNGCEAGDGATTVVVRASNETREADWSCPRTGRHPAGDYVRIAVADDGPGIAPEARAKAFDPFFTTKSPGRGLGLAAALGVVRRHRGSISIDPGEEGGTVVELFLPRCAEEAEAAAPPSPAGAEREPPPAILVVDDEEVVREVAADMLRALGFPVLLAEDGPEAIDVYRARADEIGLVLLDVQMPTLSGTEVARRLLADHPDARILLMSGHAEALVKADFGDGGATAGFLQKPYTLESLGRAVAGALNA